MQILINRYKDVKTWVDQVISKKQTAEERQAQFSCLLRVAQTCWNIGNFNSTKEILDGFDENSRDYLYDRIPVLEQLKNAFLSDKWPSPYEEALGRARSMPECPVVPFFGQFLQELKQILLSPSKTLTPNRVQDTWRNISLEGDTLEYVPSLSAGEKPGKGEASSNHRPLRPASSPSNSVNRPNSHNAPRSSVVIDEQQQQRHRTCKNNSLESIPSSDIDIRDTAWVLDKVMSFHQHHHALGRDATTGTLHRTLSLHTTGLQPAYMVDECDENDYHLDLDSYQPVEPLKYDHGVSFFPVAAPHTGMNLHLLQMLHHGSTLVHWECESAVSRTALVYARVDRACGTFFWEKPTWSTVPGECDVTIDPEKSSIPLVLTARYSSQAVDCAFVSLEEGYLDLSCVKEITIGCCEKERLGELKEACKRYGLAGSDSCIGLIYGSSLSDNRQIFLLCPPELSNVWYMGLCYILRGLKRQQQLTDRRSRWLKQKFLQLYYEEKGTFPSTWTAIRIFGGRDWSSQENASTSSPIPGGTIRKKGPRGKKTKSITNIHALTKDISFKHYESSSSDGGLSTTPTRYIQGSRESLTRIIPNSPRTSKDRIQTRSPPTGSVERLVTLPHASLQRLLCITKDKDKNGLTSGFGSMGIESSTSSTKEKPKSIITEDNQILDFINFVALFRSFILRSRKDLRELFGVHSIPCRSQSDGFIKDLRSETGEQPCVTRQTSDATPQRIGLLTRNNSIDCHDYETTGNLEKKLIFDAISASSMIHNCSGVDTSKSQVMTLATFTKFLEGLQQEKLSADNVKALIKRHEPDPTLRTQCCLSFEGFARYMMDKDNYAFVNEHELPDEEDMQQPLSHYYIASSHNTYLTGHQLKGESSVQLYSEVLLTGCRCVELDCWDGEDGTPLIYHGHTFTTKISFRSVVEAIDSSAFTTSPYPVILSIENHCSLVQQAKMASIFQSVFGEKLVTKFLYESDFDDPQLPSPSSLRYRILVKNKKLVVDPTAPLSNAPGHRTKVLISERASSVKQIRVDGKPVPVDDSSDEDYEEDDDYEDNEEKDDHSISSNEKTTQQRSQISKELSDMVIYLQAIKFRQLNINPGPSSKPRPQPHNTAQAQRHSIAGISTGGIPSSSGSPQSLSTSTSIASGGSTVENFQRTIRTMPPCFQTSSLNESAAKKICRKQPLAVLAHAETQLIRTYPAGMRIDSSNFNPVIFWAFGIQMVALNYQTDDGALHLNAAMFEQNGQCGYVRKPSVMWDRKHMMNRRFNPWDKEFDGLHSAHLTLSIISGQYIATSNLLTSTYIEIELVGIPIDCAKHKTKVIQGNALNPIWNEKFCFQVMFKDLAFLKFAVIDANSHHPIAQRVLPLKCLRPGYRHVRLRNMKNKPLSLSTLFIYSRLEEESLDYNTCCRDHKESSSSKRTIFNKEPEKLAAVDPGLGAVTLKRKMFFLMVHHVVSSEPSTILKVTQECTTTDVILQALKKAEVSPDHVNEYILVEEVSKGWEKKTKEELPTQRVLDPNEHPLQAEANWTGQGRFILKKVGDDPSSRAWLASIRSTAGHAKLSDEDSHTDEATHIWDDSDNFLVCIYNVSPEIPYAILRLPVNSSAQDVLAQALVKARRLEDPMKFVLVEELEWGGSEQVGSGKTQFRILSDNENVYSTQASWKTLGRFILREREQAIPKRHLLPATLDRISKGFSVGRSVSLPGSSKEKVPVSEALSDPTSRGLRHRLFMAGRRREVHSDGEDARESDLVHTAQHLKRITIRKFCQWKS